LERASSPHIMRFIDHSRGLPDVATAEPEAA
jgi:hypothetical protein